ncbi:single-stranded DNA-binding protein [Lewinella marina]|uniref:Single-stranded DNA-binding protein n=1 Tax=Neolewinella marina TaxID=438751 RepID=A0A2G0CHU9_9BACT|nr:single-stranded DNA-binding protein [Neolewinella marina]NJB85330.1 single-stranded DNA-binding protein [Neolewinella marina]PHK99554.1 hypothetical protein CGL56_00415 [Neolewinella marina]
MNTVTLVGRVPTDPVYHCTERGMDLTRIQLLTRDRRGQAHCHHCLAYGPAALALHEHLDAGNHLLIRGELLYRPHRIGERTVSRPYILVRGYSFLDVAVRHSISRGRPTAASGGG